MTVKIDANGILVTQPSRSIADGTSSFLLSPTLQNVAVLEKGLVEDATFWVGRSGGIFYPANTITIPFSRQYSVVKRFELLAHRTSASSNPYIPVGHFTYPCFAVHIYYQVHKDKAIIEHFIGNPVDRANIYDLYWMLFDEDVIS